MNFHNSKDDDDDEYKCTSDGDIVPPTDYATEDELCTPGAEDDTDDFDTYCHLIWNVPHAKRRKK